MSRRRLWLKRLSAAALILAALLLVADGLDGRAFYTWGPPGQHGTWSAERHWRASTERPDVPVRRAVFGCDGGYAMLMLNDLTPVHPADRLDQISLTNSFDGYYVERYDHDAPPPGTGRVQVRRRFVWVRVTHLVALLCALPAVRLVRRWRRRSLWARRAVEWTLILAPALIVGIFWRASFFPLTGPLPGESQVECFSVWLISHGGPGAGWQFQQEYGRVGLNVNRVIPVPTPAAPPGSHRKGEWYGFAYEIDDDGPAWAAMTDGSTRPLGEQWSATFEAPHWALLLLALIPLVRVPHCLSEIRGDRWARRGRCRRCAYDLTGNVSGRCPECGFPVAHRPTAG